MAEGEDDDKQYEPSQKKLDDARKKGEIAKSNDLITAGAYGGFLMCAVALGSELATTFGAEMGRLLEQSDSIAKVAFGGSQTPLFGQVLFSSAQLNAPWLLAPAVCAILAIAAQRAFLFAPSKIEPKLSRISLVQGAKNKFGRQGFFEFLKSFSKLLLYSCVLFLYLSAEIDRIISTVRLSPAQITIELGRLVIILIAIVLVISLTIGFVDFLWQRAQHIRKHRMSRKEMMDELKQSEGDPVMKQQRRKKGMDIATNRMLNDVPKADVVIVNPTHYAIALEWSRLPGEAPICIAKGMDEVAARIREIANLNAIPIHSDPPTARAIHANVDLGEEILPEHYQPVAAAIRFAEEVRRNVRGA